MAILLTSRLYDLRKLTAIQLINLNIKFQPKVCWQVPNKNFAIFIEDAQINAIP